jgi:CRP/FNR family cyclic AMP-dependent transcriptional regulator
MDESKLRPVELFADLSPRELRRLSAMTDEIVVPPGTRLINEGTYAHEFLLITAGKAEVRRDGELVAELGPGDFAGEIGVMRDARRNATVVADTELTAIVLTAGGLREVAREMPSVAEKIDAAIAARVVACPSRRRVRSATREPSLEALQGDHPPLGTAARRRHDAQLAGEVVHVIEGAVAGDPTVAHRPLVDPVDPDRAAGGGKAGWVDHAPVGALHMPGPQHQLAAGRHRRRVGLAEVEVGEGAKAVAHELLHLSYAAGRGGQRRILPDDVLGYQLRHRIRIAGVPRGLVALRELAQLGCDTSGRLIDVHAPTILRHRRFRSPAAGHRPLSEGYFRG